MAKVAVSEALARAWVDKTASMQDAAMTGDDADEDGKLHAAATETCA